MNTTDRDNAIIKSLQGSIIDFVTQFNCFDIYEGGNDWSENTVCTPEGYQDSIETWNNLLANVDHQLIIDYIKDLDIAGIIDHWQQVDYEVLVDEGIIEEDDYSNKTIWEIAAIIHNEPDYRELAQKAKAALIEQLI